MRTLIFGMVILSLVIVYFLFMTIQESFIDPEQQRGVLINFKEKIKKSNVSQMTSSIDKLQDHSNKQQEQITRLQSIIATIQAK